MQRTEVTGERVGAPIGADERVERDLADPHVAAPERLQPALDVLDMLKTRKSVWFG